MIEPILVETKEKFVIKPSKDDDIWGMYKKAVASFWTAEEVTPFLQDDISDWDNVLSYDEKNFISNVLAFFSVADGIVNENVVTNLYSEVQKSEIKAFYAFQMAIETIHSEVYSKIIETVIRDQQVLDHFMKSYDTIPSIKRKTEWCMKYMNNEKLSFAERIVAFSCVEGIFFSASFCAIFWLKKRNLMPGLCFSNELISRDEGLHTMFACLVYNKLENKLNSEKIKDIVIEAVECECMFVEDSLDVSLIGMNSATMCEYVKFVADLLLTNLGQKRHYNVQNPFPWMDSISINGKTNFHEKRVSNYNMADVGVEEDTLDYDADF